MDPEIIRAEPGRCPICGMDLVRKHPDTTTSPQVFHTDDLAAEVAMVLKPTNESVIAGVNTIRPVFKNVTMTIEAPGYLTYDLQKQSVVSARYGGRIERLYIKYPYQRVRKGQRLLDIYSPEIVTAQQELIHILNNGSSDESVLRSARQRLLLLGVTSEQLKQIELTRQPMLKLPLISTYDGFVVESRVLNTGSEVVEPVKMLGSIGGGSTAEQEVSIRSGELSLREGAFVQKGQRLFYLQSYSTMWAMLEFYPHEGSFVHVGQSVQLYIEPLSRSLSGTINYIESRYGTDNKSVRARVYLDNSDGSLKPGALLHAVLRIDSPIAQWIPKSSVLNLGRQYVVFLKRNGVFQSKRIVVGRTSGDLLEVLSGISKNDEIAATAQFLVDSESFIISH